MHDLVIRGGTVVDGSGRPGRRADVGIDGDRIVAVGNEVGQGKRMIDADGHVVTPGFVDVHTHFDGQVTWDPYLSPSSSHGVTTLVFGNCGIGVAPMRVGDRDFALQLIEGVEDIPQPALLEGIRWGWESYPEYLDFLDRSDLAIDVGSLVPHGALRVFVMGERGTDHSERATTEEIETMSRLAREGLAAGAVGISTSRTRNQRGSDGRITPTYSAAREELLGLAAALGDAGHGYFQVVADGLGDENEFAVFRDMARLTGRRVSLAVVQPNQIADGHVRVLEQIEAANADGLDITAQVAVRTVGFLLAFNATLHPFVSRPSFRALDGLPDAERLTRLRDPAVRAQILSEPSTQGGMMGFVAQAWNKMFVLGDPPDYEPRPENSVAATAQRLGWEPAELAYDLLLQKEGTEILYVAAFNYANDDFAGVRDMLLHPFAYAGLSDAGAHCGYICDASSPTFTLTHWARDRDRGPRLPLEHVVHAQTQRNADLLGLNDRGLVSEGMKADINVLDFDNLRLHAPKVANDLPAGGRRLVQYATGYRATIVNGAITFADDEPTGDMPGRLVRAGR